MLGAGLLFGDGFITPAISVLSAVEGLNVATPALAAPGDSDHRPAADRAVRGAVQGHRRHRQRVRSDPAACGSSLIGILGAAQIEQQPAILAAFNPLYGLKFLARAGAMTTLLVLGALMLVVTGGEAMYADMGHFGALPIRISWFSVVYPALLLNYLGQGAFL